MANEKSLRNRISGLGIALAAVALLIVVCWSTVRAHMQAAAILQQMESKHVSLLFAGVALHGIHTTDLAIHPAGAPDIRGRLYEPADIAQPRDIVLVHGVHRLGIDDTRLMTLAAALAHAGFRVLTPEIASLKSYKVPPDATRQIQQSIAWLSDRDSEKTGVIGISFAGGLALLAEADNATAAHTAWVWSIGGHASMQRVAEYYATGHATGADGSTFSQTPHEYGPLVFILTNPDQFLTPADQAALLPVLRAHLYENSKGEELLVSHLNAAQKEKWKSLLDFRSGSFNAHAQAWLQNQQSQFASVSPEGHVASLQMPVFLLHGAADNVVPPTELSWVAKDLPAGDVRKALVSTAISHVSLENDDPGVVADWQLVHFFAAVLQQAQK